MSLVVAGEAKAANATGNGPVNPCSASRRGGQPVLRLHPVLTEYEIKPVGGEDAQGQVLVPPAVVRRGPGPRSC